MDDGPYVVEVRGLRASFGGREVLRGVDAAFPLRAVSVVIGRSGSGKSTLLRSIDRLNEELDGHEWSGEVRIRSGGEMVPVAGRGAPPLAALRRKAGMVFQRPDPLPISIRRNISLPLELARPGLSRGEVEDVMREELIRVGLWGEVSDRLDAPATGLSGGQQQRLCLARALALSPELLLLDEPTASLDRAAADTIERLILDLVEHVSVIMVTHSLAQAARLADRAIVMDDGRVRATFDGPGLRAAIEGGSLMRMMS